MLAAVTITTLYFIPVVYICYQAFLIAGSTYYKDETKDDDDLYIECKRMIDWLMMMMKRSDLGTWGLVISSLIHIQIYCLIFVM